MPTADALRADDILTTVRLAQVELRIRPDSIAAVADASVGLLAWTAWARLTSRLRAGPLHADMGGADLTSPRTWVKGCYIPLLLAAGGAAALSRLGSVGGSFSGVRAADRRLLPSGCRAAARRRNLQGLLRP